ncbi:MAG: conjugal transfer protein TraN, partial [Alphaproteobacteria bacterium]|nr:conjugal transfer protein TraN [Alphaproteobacteria bacterium]
INPERTLLEPLQNILPSSEFDIKTCEESKSSQEYKCSKSLLPPEFHIEPAKYSNYWCSKGNHRPDDPKCRAKTYYPVARMYAPEKIRIIGESWTSTCQTLENYEQSVICKLVRKECPEGPETRDIVGTLGPENKPASRPIARDCWRYDFYYSCSYPSKNNCHPLRKSGCNQIKSKCIKTVENTCLVWEQTYKCPKNAKIEEIKNPHIKLPSPPQIPEIIPNRDMDEAITKLASLKEIQNDIRASNFPSNADSIDIFKGQSKKCTIAFGGFKNCCTNGKGWGISLNLSGCDGEELDLAQRKDKGLCVEIGTYCAEKIPVVGCIKKKKGHCCFPTKLARLLHEQGRPQIGFTWGDSEHPDCRGFKPEELSRINFDKINLSELYRDFVTPNLKSSEVVRRNLSTRVEQITRGFKKQATQ